MHLAFSVLRFPIEGILEVIDGGLEAVGEGDAGGPVEEGLRFGDIGAALFRVVGGEGFVDDGRGGIGEGDDLMGEVEDAEFGGVADVDGPGFGGIHQADGGFNEIVYVAERTGLRAVAIDGNGLVVEGLDDEVGDDAAVVRMHAGAVGIENASHSDGNVVLPVIVEKKRLRAPLPLVITGADSNRVDVAPISFGLRVNVGIAVYFAGGGLEDFTLKPLGEAEEVESAKHACFHCLDGVGLIMERRCGTGKIVDFIDFYMERKANIVADPFKMSGGEKVFDVFSRAGEKIIDAEHFVPLSQKAFA